MDQFVTNATYTSMPASLIMNLSKPQQIITRQIEGIEDCVEVGLVVRSRGRRRRLNKRQHMALILVWS